MPRRSRERSAAPGADVFVGRDGFRPPPIHACRDLVRFVQDYLRLDVAVDRKGCPLVDKAEGDRQVAPTKRRGAGGEKDETLRGYGRRSSRLRGYDYAEAGAYFVTICTQHRACLFGEVVDGEMQLNRCGRIVSEEWIRTGDIRENVELDTFVIMPNHFHGIVLIAEDGRGTAPYARTWAAVVDNGVGATCRSPIPKGPAPGSIGAVIAGFKSATAKWVNQLRRTSGARVWQRGYYEHVIRNEAGLQEIRQYIANNALKWDLDGENPENH